MKVSDLKKSKIAILSLAFLTMISVLNVITSSLATAFPEASTLALQMSVSCAGLTTIVMAFLTPSIYRALTRRRAVILAMAVLILCSVLVYFYHPSIAMIYVFSLTFGITGSLYIPAVTSAIIDYYDGKEKLDLLSKQSVLSSAGGMLFTFVIGFLANISWNTSFLVFLLIIPSLILCILYYPQDLPVQEPKEETKTKAGVSPAIIKYGLIALSFIICFGVYMVNISLYVAEKNIGTTAFTGTLGAIMMLGGILGGALFKMVSEKLDNRIFVLSFGMLALCYFVLARTESTAVIVVLSFLIGLAQGIHMPQCMLGVSREISQSESVLGSAVICNFAPNIGNMASPIIITTISTLLFGEAIGKRFILAACIAAAIAALMLLNTRKKGN